MPESEKSQPFRSGGQALGTNRLWGEIGTVGGVGGSCWSGRGGVGLGVGGGGGLRSRRPQAGKSQAQSYGLLLKSRPGGEGAISQPLLCTREEEEEEEEEEEDLKMHIDCRNAKPPICKKYYFEFTKVKVIFPSHLPLNQSHPADRRFCASRNPGSRT